MEFIWILDLGSWSLISDSVAQLVEQYTFNVWVLGSSPSGITKVKKKALQSRIRGAFDFFTGGFTGKRRDFEIWIY